MSVRSQPRSTGQHARTLVDSDQGDTGLGAFTPRESVDLEVVPATREHAATIANLFELYAHDFSEFHDVELGEDGRFGYKNLPLYWSEPNRHAFLFSVRQKLAGFALVKRGSEITGDECVWDM